MKALTMQIQISWYDPVCITVDVLEERILEEMIKEEKTKA